MVRRVIAGEKKTSQKPKNKKEIHAQKLHHRPKFKKERKHKCPRKNVAKSVKEENRSHREYQDMVNKVKRQTKRPFIMRCQ